MSFFKRLFGGAGREGGGANAPAETAPKPAAKADYNGYQMAATPQAEGGQFRLCGTITKEIDGAVKQHLLIRADMFTARDDAADAFMRKARQVIDEQGDAIFE